MKKILSIALCAATASAFAAGEPVAVEVGTVGVTAITTSLSNAIVAVSYDDLADDKGGMVYSNLVKTTNLTVNDKLIQFSYDGSDKGKYTSWLLKEGTTSGGAKYNYWEGQAEAYKDDSGSDLLQTSPAPDTVRGAVGTGIWLVRQKPIAEGGSTNTFYIYGKPVTSKTVQLAKGKWNLVGNPTTNEVTITEEMVVGAANYDQIVTPVAPSGKLCYYTFWSGSGWLKPNSDGTGWVAEPPKLGSGLGCWIKTKNEATINWPSDK